MAANGKELMEVFSPHTKWVENQGIPVYRAFSIPSLKDLKLGSWARTGAQGAYVLLDGAEDSNDSYVLELLPGKTCLPEHHIYEEIFFVLSGRGATVAWQDQDRKVTFEWTEGSLFAIPPNAWHQFFNVQAGEPARLYAVSSAPLVINLFRDLSFVLDNNHVFKERFEARTDFFKDEGRALPGRIWETNFISDVRNVALLAWNERGAGGVNRRLELADGCMAAHVSQFPVGTYKKAHRHGPGTNVIIIEGYGYSLLWEEGKENQKLRVDWQEGSVLVPPNMWFHQHFNTGPKPAKYLAIRWGSFKNHVLKAWSRIGKGDVSVKKGGSQIEYEDEDPAVRQLFEQELATNGVKCLMPTV